MAGNLCADMTVLASEEDGAPQEIATKNSAASGTLGDEGKITWSVENGTLTIRGEGRVWGSYNSTDTPWSDFSDQIRKVVIDEGISYLDTGEIPGNTTEISIPASLTGIGFGDYEDEDGDAHPLFGGKLEKITVATDNPQYASVDGVLYNKDKTHLICFPRARTGAFKVPDGVTELGDGIFAAFMGSELTSITIPEGVTEVYTFASCRNLTSITLPESVQAVRERTNTPVFRDCTSLTSITVLNKELALKRSGGIKKEVTIYGYSGSTAEAFAKENGNEFIALDSQGSTSGKEPVTGNTEKTAVKVSKIKISGDTKKVAAGKKIKLKVSVLPTNAANKGVTWKSSNKKVATVSSSGVVTMKKGSSGKKVTITAAAKDGSGKKATYTLQSMKGAVKSIKITGKTTVKAGKTLKLKGKVTAQKNANKAVKWTSSNTKYAKVSGSGKVTALKAGKGKKVKITVKALDGSNVKKSITIRIK